MRIILRFLILVALQLQTCSGLKVLVPSDPETALVGSTVTLPCRFRVKPLPVNRKFLSIIWKFGGEEILKFTSSGIDAKPRASMDFAGVSDGDASLILSNVTIHDEGTYRCNVTYVPSRKVKGIELHVQAAPSVSKMRKHVTWSRKTQLLCLITDFYPRDIKVTWFRNGQLLETPDTSIPQRNADGTYQLNSSVTLTAAETWGHSLIECQVEHGSLQKPIKETFMVEEDKMMFVLDMAILGAIILSVALTCVIILVLVHVRKRETYEDPSIKISLEESGYVICSLALMKYNPKDLQMIWSYADEACEQLRDIEEIGHSEKNECRISGNHFNHPGFKVRVTWFHESMDGPDWREVSAKDIARCPQMSDIVTEPWVHGTEAQLSCTISGYFPDIMSISWIRNEPWQEEYIPIFASKKYRLPKVVTKKQDDNTYTCTAVLFVNVSADMDNGVEFFCQVEHLSQWRTLEKRSGLLHVKKVPAVGVTYCGRFWKSLVAEIKGFYPKKIEIAWSLLDGNEYKEYTKFTNEISWNIDRTYSVLSKCKDSRSRKQIHKTFKLTVNHETLESPIETVITRQKGAYYIVNEVGESLVPRRSS